MKLEVTLSKMLTMQGIEKDDSKVSKKKSSGCIDGRALKERYSTEDAIALKRNSARNQAKKLIGDAYNNDEKLAQGIRDLEKERGKKLSERSELQDMIKNVTAEKENISKKYGIDPDSQEQKDYELLEKYQNNINGASYDSFSEEELDRLRELKDVPRTAYQVEMLSLNNIKSRFEAEIKQLDRDIEGIAQGITDAHSEQDKSQDMIKAQKASDTIFAAMEKEILGMLVEEGKNNIDETAKEQEEEAKKAAEEKEEKEEQLEKAKERKEEQEELIEKQREADLAEQELSIKSKSVDQMGEAQKAVAKILKDNNLLNEDLKGIDIDLNF